MAAISGSRFGGHQRQLSLHEQGQKLVEVLHITADSCLLIWLVEFQAMIMKPGVKLTVSAASRSLSTYALDVFGRKANNSY